MVEDGEFVVPGTELGYSEEFIPGEGAYEEDGKVYAARTGTLVIDMKERKITVTPKTSVPPIPNTGDVVIGKVIDVKPQNALVSLVKIKGIDRSLPGEVLGSIHISQTRNVYVADLGKEFRVGDIVLAKVTNAKRTPIQLSTVHKELGVIRGLCSRCAVPLIKSDNRLKCPDCGRTEARRISPSYGSGEV